MSKYAIVEDGKTPYERVHLEDCVTPLVPFGKAAMYLPVKTIHRHKGVPAKKMGVWLGISERTEEVLISTKYGVIKCRTMDRFNDAEKWDKSNVLEMVGTPWEPVPSKNNQHVPVDVAEDGEFMGADNENEEVHSEPMDDEAGEQELISGMEKFHASKKAIREFGEIDGCPACEVIKTRSDQPGRIGRHHSGQCRRRILDLMKEDPKY